MHCPASAEPEFEFLGGALRTFGKRGVSRLILFEEHALRRAVSNSSSTFIMNAIIRAGAICSYSPPARLHLQTQATAVRCHERLGGLLNYSRAA
jgi:hypothetical protein